MQITNKIATKLINRWQERFPLWRTSAFPFIVVFSFLFFFSADMYFFKIIISDKAMFKDMSNAALLVEFSELYPYYAFFVLSAHIYALILPLKYYKSYVFRYIFLWLPLVLAFISNIGIMFIGYFFGADDTVSAITMSVLGTLLLSVFNFELAFVIIFVILMILFMPYGMDILLEKCEGLGKKYLALKKYCAKNSLILDIFALIDLAAYPIISFNADLRYDYFDRGLSLTFLFINLAIFPVCYLIIRKSIKHYRSLTR